MHTLVKEAPGVDYYVMWSTVVDGPLFGGTREETLPYLWTMDERWPDEIHGTDPSHPENMLRTVDSTGTSARYGEPPMGVWGDASWTYDERGDVTRANVFVLARRLGDDEAADVADLLTPAADDTPTDDPELAQARDRLPRASTVTYWPGYNTEYGRESVTRSEVWRTPRGHLVVKIDGYAGEIGLSHITRRYR